jgi:hypothetical protein
VARSSPIAAVMSAFRLTLSTNGHVIDELEDQPHLDAEAAILAARCGSSRQLPAAL